MKSLLSPINTHVWPFLALLIAAAMLAAAHAFETFGGLPPCPLCLRQREVYWALIAMIVTGLVLLRLKPTRRFRSALNVLIGLVFVTGAVVASYHAGVEWKIFPPPTGCSVGPGFNPLEQVDLSAPMQIASCTDAPFYILGLSMAGWNVVASVVFAVLSFIAAGRSGQRD
jgi:disulfide bond formation protein DsbB